MNDQIKMATKEPTKRGRKAKGQSLQKNTLLSFVKVTADESSNKIVNSILNDIVNKLPLSSLGAIT